MLPKINTYSSDRTDIFRLNDTTIEERVTALEFQVEIEEIVILLEDQVQQNERLLELEIDSDGLCTGFIIRFKLTQQFLIISDIEYLKCAVM